MKKYSLLLLLAPLVFAIASCQKKDENNLTPEQVQEAKLIASQWKATGIYTTNATTPLQTFNLTLDFRDGNGTTTNTDNTILVNGSTPLLTQWKVNAEGNLLTMKIPSASAILSAGTDVTAIVSALVGAADTEIRISLSDTDLVIFGDTGKDINLFGIPLPAGAELRFNKTGVATEVPTNNLLTAVTWKGEGVYANGINQNINVANQTMKFGTNLLGLNTVTISGVTAPVTWSINDANNPTQLTLTFPKIGNTAARIETFAISALSSTNLNLKGTSSNKVNIIIAELDVDTELRMVPQ